MRKTAVYVTSGVVRAFRPKYPEHCTTNAHQILLRKKLNDFVHSGIISKTVGWDSTLDNSNVVKILVETKNMRVFNL